MKIFAVLLLCATSAWAQTSANGLLEEAVPPGANYDKAEFRFWAPKTSTPLR